MSKCDLFQSIAAQTWDIISNNHRRGMRLHEEGVTRQTIISSIHDYVENHRRFDVFVQKAKNEVRTGGDLELFLQVKENSFFRILLQSKLMEMNGEFESLDKMSGSSGNKQYDTLLSYGQQINSPVFYLMYNGHDSYKCTASDCVGHHDEKQYGCAIVNAIDIKNHCDSNNTGRLGNRASPKPYGKPWRFITCCGNNLNSKIYTADEINFDPYFNKLFEESLSTNFITPELLMREHNLIDENNKVHKKGWEPAARIILANQYMAFNNDGFIELI